MDPSIIAAILAALTSGALAKTTDVASDIVGSAYEALKQSLARRLGRSAPLEALEEEPESVVAQQALVKAIAAKPLEVDAELQADLRRLEDALANWISTPAADIDIQDVHGHVNAVVEQLVATGHIQIGSVVAETGDARVSGLRAGATERTVTQSADGPNEKN
jgi:hypothetical protein